MNREIKFRVWVSFDKNFTYFDVYEYPQGIAGGVSEPMQYTGLKDKNGKEIYEGDILLDDAKIPLECFYDNGKFMAGISYASQEWFSECEIVGNIFENKDLLEQ